MKPKIIVQTIVQKSVEILEKALPSKKKPSSSRPLRSELFSTLQMEQHGLMLGERHKLSFAHAPDMLLKRLAENEDIINETCRLLIDVLQENRHVPPAAEWLLDNFYLVEEQIRTAKRHLPKGYSRGLPRLLKGTTVSHPRVYDIAIEITSHTDAHITAESLTHFMTSYQGISPLKLGELWAIPIMLRLALIENLRRVAEQLSIDSINRTKANKWADSLIDMAENDPSSLIVVVGDMARSELDLQGSFVAEFSRRLQGYGHTLSVPMTWIEQRLTSQMGTTAERLIQADVRQQAADQVTISNSIASLRFLGSTNWRQFVEDMSTVEDILKKDPADAYAQMDFTTRDRYRHVIEIIAKNSNLNEEEVSLKALSLARAATTTQNIDPRTSHIGYYLIDKGLPELEAAVAMRLSLADKCRRLAMHSPLSFYLGTIGFLTCLFTLLILNRPFLNDLSDGLTVFIGLLVMIGTSHFSITIVNWISMLLTKPRLLPRFDFSTGIPPQSHTMVAVPTLLINMQNISELLEGIEVRYLANTDANLSFCLLTDFADAASEEMPIDEKLLDAARQGIDALNSKYTREGTNIFFLFHRPRQWNGQENKWMGYERKRGKLSALNAYLRDTSRNAFSCIVGDTASLPHVKYVITLDTDTTLPRDTARQFIAAMEHPLNRPFYDEQKRRVTRGYGIIQPRVAVSLPGMNASIYTQLSSGEPGIDPYTRTVSDVYQDLFGEGSFVGKGIYDIDQFEKSLEGRFPDNRILSHDLIEGAFARSGLLSDVQLYEEFPARYSADVSRRHRWIRGDWQIARWIMPTTPTQNKQTEKNTLSMLSRWKIFDNLRRSIVPVAFTALLLMGWTLTDTPWFWNVVVTGMIMLPVFCACILNIFRKSKDMSLKQHLAGAMRSSARQIMLSCFNVLILAYEAFYHVDSILRVLWRMIVSKQGLLEWNPSALTNRTGGTDMMSVYRIMWFAPLFSLMLGLYIGIESGYALMAAFPFLIGWACSPAIVCFISRPTPRKEEKLNLTQEIYLGKLSRKIWRFFETYAGAEDHFLPPDNIQEQPIAVIAHRTSPTNIGMSLLSNLAAYDFGYISARSLIDRTAATFNTMSKLERHRGHFYNWYDTLTLQPLMPVYISTVDSGNLAGHLLTLRPGLNEIIDRDIVNTRFFGGLKDTLGILIDSFSSEAPASFHDINVLLENTITAPPVTLSAFLNKTHIFLNWAQHLKATHSDKTETEVREWTDLFLQQCQDMHTEIVTFAPWLLDEEAVKEHPQLDGIYTLRQLLTLATTNTDFALDSLIHQVRRTALERIKKIESLIIKCGELSQMEYEFLYDKQKNLFSIGYKPEERKLDVGYYDLLASEARLCSYIAIAQGQIPQENWFALGRQLTSAEGNTTLLSWSGSMFEYLMPLLVMPTFEHTLLDQTYKAAVRHQIQYGTGEGLPWGISESGYYTFDAHLNYQYRAFGAPGLGLKRGLGSDLVIAPYASAMALMVTPDEACKNLIRMSKEGFEGRFGHYEAIDYTPARVPRGKSYAIVQSFMSHHQGMSFLSLAYLLLDRPMQRRFASDPLMQSAILLLHEKIPQAVAFYSNTNELTEIRNAAPKVAETPIRILYTPHTPMPEVQLLSNGRYHIMMTNAGGNSSRWKDIDVTRWREDATRDNWGSFCYIRDVDKDAFWSTTYQPTLKKPSLYEVIFSEGKAEFRRRDEEIETHTEIVVSPEDDIDLRRTKITNLSRRRRIIEITSYAEVVLAPHAADASHKTFSNLFVQTEILKKSNAIICTRRPRSAHETPPYMFHQMVVHGAVTLDASYETDRMKFIGRGQGLDRPLAMTDCDVLSGSQGSVLDPIVAIRQQITLEPDQSAIIDIVSGAAKSRDICLSLIDKYRDKPLADRVAELAWTHGHVILRQINATEADAELYNRLASAVIYPNADLRSDASILIRNRRGQSGLWSYAISGDHPIVLLHVKDQTGIDLVRQLVQAHAYWRLKGLIVDLVIWNEEQTGYRQLLQDQIMDLITSGIEAHTVDRPGGIFVRAGDQISEEDKILLKTVARAVISDRDGDLAEQLNRRTAKDIRIPRLLPAPAIRPAPVQSKQKLPLSLQKEDLILFNDIGGFTADGKEYAIISTKDSTTPAPWVNVIANPFFGTVISEQGQSYTWGENAHSFRLTPWNNDPVIDAGGEVFYLRDEETGDFWSPAPRPVHSNEPYLTRHGFGYSVFEHHENEIHSELCIYVAMDAPIKFSVLKIRNMSGRPRKIAATGYVEWVMGDLRDKTGMHITTEIDAHTGALLASNAYNTEFADRIAFFDVDDTSRTFTSDRREFIGRNGSLQNPAAMAAAHLSGKTGAGLDACAALQVSFDLADGEEKEIIFKLGVTGRHHGDNAGLARRFTEAGSLIRRFRGSSAARIAFDSVQHHWKEALGTVQIKTGDPSIDILTNGWLVYQTLACRFWARSGFYQSGGAIGFRDQLQDAMALIHTKPYLLREHLLLCASHQFVDGDVQHWWHPPNDRGVRTKCSDDFLWLPLAACRYIKATGDTGILDEMTTFLEGRPLNADEDSYYDLPNRSTEQGSLYEHCVRAIRRGSKLGIHGLPLIGSCDWNDGMDKVGEHGLGESVWLAFFTHDILNQFSKVATDYGDADFAAYCLETAETLRLNAEQNGWDGNWYRRAYFDDGSPLGSAANDECQIDSLSQSWAVLSGAGSPERTKQAMHSLDQRLIRRDDALILLLDPPFDKSGPNPGYIRGYVPGVRENGGQYTHAAIWTAMAFAHMGDNQKAWELFQLINPINHARNRSEAELYRVEPYVVTADVYGAAPHIGRGGWSWYTGSSGWMYRLITESLLGIELKGNTLTIRPRLPVTMPSFKLEYRHKGTVYKISVTRAEHAGQTALLIDNQLQASDVIQLEENMGLREIELRI